MAAIDDLIAQIGDRALREQLENEAKRMVKKTTFGLVFQGHLPELMPIYSAKLRKGCLVAEKYRSLNSLWRVLSIRAGQANCLRHGGDERRKFKIDELVVVRQFGEPIYPSLIPIDRVQNATEQTPWHILIEADNYHALQLLEYLYTGQVDCIYIDPPYNTGDKSWKYNNDYVDKNDAFRHSKWLSFIFRRLQLAERLLSPDGVLIITIDEHEVHNLGVLLTQTLKRVRDIQMVTIVNNTAGSMSPGKFSRAEEYAFFCFYGDAKPAPMATDMLSEATPVTQFWFPLFRSRGLDDRPSKRPNLVYPVAVDPVTLKITGVGKSLKERYDAGEISEDLDSWKPDLDETLDGKPVVWPILDSNDVSRWQLGRKSLLKLYSEGFVRVRKSKTDGPRPFTISYIKAGNRKKILNGEVAVAGREPDGAYILHSGARTTIAKTIWKVRSHDARLYGTTMLRSILGQTSFSYPKSPYATADTIQTVMADKKDALIVDFFAGSGTTLHSVALLNDLDGGNRQCIMVTNNEVSESEANMLTDMGLHPEDPEWEKVGICQSITWPRSKYAILGRRDDRTKLEGDYPFGKTQMIEQSRKFMQISFTSIEDLKTAEKKKQLVSLIDNIPQTVVKKDSNFIVSEKHTASILFDKSSVDEWIEALDEQEHITSFYIVTKKKASFENISRRISELLGPVTLLEDVKRPMKKGFPANLEYFRLGFLDKDYVELGRQFREILPLLWLRSGAKGPRPNLPKSRSIPSMIIPENNSFSVLVDETRFADFFEAVEKRDDITHVFLVTDSEEVYQDMAAQLSAPNVVQLYRDYLENFVINK